MTFVVEDGTKPTGANSYVSVEVFEAHFADRNLDVSDFGDAEIQGAAVQATDYIDKRFGRRFRGYRATRTQGLEWPRYDALDNDGYSLASSNEIPQQLLKATSEYARLVLVLGRSLTPTPALGFPIIDEESGETISPSAGAIKRDRQVVGPIETDITYADPAKFSSLTSRGSSLVSAIPEYPIADLWIEELLRSASSRRVARG